MRIKILLTIKVDNFKNFNSIAICAFLILQGLYPGNHGVLSNKLYDQTFGRLGYSYELFHYNQNTVPIWVISQLCSQYSKLFLYFEKLNQYSIFHAFMIHAKCIQTANELAGKHSGCMMWPGSEFEYKGTTCTFTEKFEFNKNWEGRVDTAISWFNDPKTPANLVMLYIEQPDAFGEGYGPQSKEACL